MEGPKYQDTANYGNYFKRKNNPLNIHRIRTFNSLFCVATGNILSLKRIKQNLASSFKTVTLYDFLRCPVIPYLHNRLIYQNRPPTSAALFTMAHTFEIQRIALFEKKIHRKSDSYQRKTTSFLFSRTLLPARHLY